MTRRVPAVGVFELVAKRRARPREQPLAIDLRRQGDLVPVWLREEAMTVVGCGTTGSWVAHSLLRMGFTGVRVIDCDRVEGHNVPMQFHFNQPTMAKVDAFERAHKALNLPMPRATYFAKVEEVDDFAPGTVFSCLDEIDPRRTVLRKAIDSGARRLVDLRMGPVTGEVLLAGVEGPMEWSEYAETLEGVFVDEPACGRRAFLPTALALVGLALGHWISAEAGRVPLKKRFMVDVAANFMFDLV